MWKHGHCQGLPESAHLKPGIYPIPLLLQNLGCSDHQRLTLWTIALIAQYSTVIVATESEADCKIVADVSLSFKLGSCPMPLLRQNLGEQKQIVLMRPTHRQRSVRFDLVQSLQLQRVRLQTTAQLSSRIRPPRGTSLRLSAAKR